jgi:hypothetical protein
MFSPALPTDAFWDSSLGRMVPAAATIQLANLGDSLGKCVQDNPSVLEDMIRTAEANGFTAFRRDPGLLLRRLGLDAGKFDVEGFRKGRVPPTAEGINGLMLQFIDEVENGPPPPPPDVSQLTGSDWGAIGRLCELGFPESRVIQAYFMTQRDEKTAADFLLEYSGISNHPAGS